MIAGAKRGCLGTFLYFGLEGCNPHAHSTSALIVANASVQPSTEQWILSFPRIMIRESFYSFIALDIISFTDQTWWTERTE